MLFLTCALVAVVPHGSQAETADRSETSTLDNGLTVILKEDHSRDIIALNVFVDGGARTESADISGLSHFYEHLIFRGGSKRLGMTELRRQFQGLGEFYGYTDFDLTDFHFVVPTSNFDEALWRFTDGLMELIPNANMVEIERQVVLEELDQRYIDDPSGRVFHQLLRNAYTTHPYGRTRIGSREVIESANLASLRTFYNERYVPNQMIMAVVGDFESREMLAKIEGAFGGYRRGRESFETGETEPEQTEFIQTELSMDVASTYAMLGYHTPNATHPDFTVLLVLDAILGKGHASRLGKALVYDQPIAAEFYTYLPWTVDPGLFMIYCQADPLDEKKALQTIWKEIANLASAGPSEAELEAAKARLENQHALKNETYLDQAQSLCRYALIGDPHLETTYIPRIRAVSTADIRRVVARYLKPSNCTLSLVRSSGAEAIGYRDVAYSFDRHDPLESEKPPARPATRRSLTNGLRVIVEEDHASETAGVTLLFRGGLWAERSKLGIANLVAEVLPRGTLYKSREEVTSTIDKLGISLETSADQDFITLKVACASRVFPEAFRLVHEIAFEPSFEKYEVEKARSLILERISSLKDDSYEFAENEFKRLIYGSSVYSGHKLGTSESVTSMKVADLKEFHWRTFTPANAVLCIVGDVNQQEVFQLAESILGGMPSGSEFEFERGNVPGVREASELRIKRNQAQVILEMGFMGPAVTEADYINLKPAVSVLSSRLFYKYVYDEPITYRMWVWTSPLAGPSPIRFETGVALKDFETSYTGIKTAVRDFVESGFSEEEFEHAKADIIQSFLLAHETNLKRSSAMAMYEGLGLGFDYLQRYPKLIEAVTKDIALRTAQEYMDLESQIVVITGQLEE